MLRKKKSEKNQGLIKEEYPGLDFLGLQDILTSKTKWYKSLWILVLFVNLTLGTICTVQVFSEYLARPTATLITYQSTDKLLLPQVTVCGTVPDYIDFDDFHKFSVDTFPELDNATMKDLLVFIVAGSGFQKFDSAINAWNAAYKDELQSMYEKLRGNRTVKEFFHLTQDSFGLQCDDLFQQCKLGEDTLDCCKVFQPTYTIRRGKCFRSIGMNQTSYDEIGKLGLRFKEPKKLFPALSNEELILYLNEYKTDIGPFPRNYLYAHDFNKFRVRATVMNLMERQGVCINENNEIGKSTCYIEKWLEEHLENKFNCTFPYMDMLRAPKVSPCEPRVIIDNYAATLQADGYDAHDCVLACHRTEYDIQVERTKSNFSKAAYKYRADINYNDLQFQQIDEVSTISFLGMVAQLGGQLGLFLGSSIIDIIQLFLIVSIILARYARTAIYEAPQQNNVMTVHVLS